MMRPADMRTESERGGIKKLIGKTKFPANFKEKVNMSKVNMETMAPWIQSEVEKYVGFDDDVLVGYVQSQLVPPDGSPVDPRAVQMNLMGFLEKHTSTFMAELCALNPSPDPSPNSHLAPTLTRTLTPAPTLTRWSLLLSAQRHPMGIPEEFIERKRAARATRRPPPAARVRVGSPCLPGERLHPHTGTRPRPPPKGGQGEDGAPCRSPLTSSLTDRREEIRQKKAEAARVLEQLREKRAEVERAMAAETARRKALEKRDWPEAPKPKEAAAAASADAGAAAGDAAAAGGAEAGAGAGAAAGDRDKGKGKEREPKARDRDRDRDRDRERDRDRDRDRDRGDRDRDRRGGDGDRRGGDGARDRDRERGDRGDRERGGDRDQDRERERREPARREGGEGGKEEKE